MFVCLAKYGIVCRRLPEYNVGSTLPIEIVICICTLHKVDQYFNILQPILKLVQSYRTTQFSPKLELN